MASVGSVSVSHQKHCFWELNVIEHQHLYGQPDVFYSKSLQCRMIVFPTVVVKKCFPGTESFLLSLLLPDEPLYQNDEQVCKQRSLAVCTHPRGPGTSSMWVKSKNLLSALIEEERNH